MKRAYPNIPHFEPVWAVGNDRPELYVNSATGETKPTPDYETYQGFWTTEDDEGCML